MFKNSFTSIFISIITKRRLIELLILYYTRLSKIKIINEFFGLKIRIF